MNDFTKEELSTILHWGIDRVMSIGTECFEEEGGDKLYEKLRVMIDTHCDHDYSTCNEAHFKCQLCGERER